MSFISRAVITSVYDKDSMDDMKDDILDALPSQAVYNSV
jgi:hypothetical protein